MRKERLWSSNDGSEQIPGLSGHKVVDSVPSFKPRSC